MHPNTGACDTKGQRPTTLKHHFWLQELFQDSVFALFFFAALHISDLTALMSEQTCDEAPDTLRVFNSTHRQTPKQTPPPGWAEADNQTGIMRDKQCHGFTAALQSIITPKQAMYHLHSVKAAGPDPQAIALYLWPVAKIA